MRSHQIEQHIYEKRQNWATRCVVLTTVAICIIKQVITYYLTLLITLNDAPRNNAQSQCSAIVISMKIFAFNFDCETC